MSQIVESNHRRYHSSPLRYPGGKGKLRSFIKSVIEQNKLHDISYVEPYAGGAAIAIDLLIEEYVNTIYINDLSRPIFCFWRSVLDFTDEFLRRIHDTKISVRNWKEQKKILMNAGDYDDISIGFAAFFLNRTNRSGILNGGVIGGLKQDGGWKIDARFNKNELSARITSIARLRRRIKVTQKDAVEFLNEFKNAHDGDFFMYLDPPYYNKGRQLYYDYYTHDDHVTVSKTLRRKFRKDKWIISYDNTPEIRNLYTEFKSLSYGIGYSARKISTGDEVMFFSPALSVPPLAGSMKRVSLQ